MIKFPNFLKCQHTLATKHPFSDVSFNAVRPFTDGKHQTKNDDIGLVSLQKIDGVVG